MRKARRLLAAVLVVVAVASLHGGARGQQPTTVRLSLVAGWNNVPYLGQTAPVAQVLSSLGNTYGTVWEFDPVTQAFRGYEPGLPHASDLQHLTTQRAFWVYLRQPATFTYAVTPVSEAIILYQGLNNIAYVGQEAPLAEVFAPVAGRVRGVWRWDPAMQRWEGAIPGAPQASEFSTMTPGRAYSIQIDPGASVVLRGPEILRPIPSPSAMPRVCFTFQSRQPDLAELHAAFNRAGHGRLFTDEAFALPRMETQPDGDGNLVPGHVPPTLLKAIAWTESSWRHAAYEVPRGMTGRTLASSSCAFGVMQILTDMDIRGQPTPRQNLIGTDYRYNIATGARILIDKWNAAPSVLPVVKERQPHVLEDWYFAVWAYHCYGERCTQLGLHDNPDDPALSWPRPMFNSPEQLNSRGRFTRADYPYQELVFGVIQHPPLSEGTPVWRPLSVKLPPPGTVSHPMPASFERPGMTLDPTQPEDP
jgi:hypothetical protein